MQQTTRCVVASHLVDSFPRMPQLSARVFWLFGLPGSGKTTLAHALRDLLHAEGRTALVLDDEELHAGFTPHADFSGDGRLGEVRRASELAKTLAAQGAIVIVALLLDSEQHRLLA